MTAQQLSDIVAAYACEEMTAKISKRVILMNEELDVLKAACLFHKLWIEECMKN